MSRSAGEPPVKEGASAARVSRRASAAASTVAQTPCPLCQDRNAWTVSRRDRRRRPLHTVICQGCGLVRVDPLPRPEELADYYHDAYREDYKGSAVARPRHVWREFVAARRRVANLAPLLDADCRVLDVGSSLGAVVALLQARGVSASGVEPNREYARYAADAWGIEVHNVPFLQYSGAQSYDLVTFFHVIEHMSDFMANLSHAAGILKEGGRICVEVPDILSTVSSPSGRFHSAHVVGFSVETLTRALEQAGFGDVEVRGKDGLDLVGTGRRCGRAQPPPLAATDPRRVLAGLTNHTVVRYAVGLRWVRRMVVKSSRWLLESWVTRPCHTQRALLELVRRSFLSP